MGSFTDSPAKGDRSLGQTSGSTALILIDDGSKDGFPDAALMTAYMVKNSIHP